MNTKHEIKKSTNEAPAPHHPGLQKIKPHPSRRAEKLRRAKDALEEHIHSLAEQIRQGRSEQLTRYLEYCAKFHHYSFGNLMLALAQRPNLTRIAGLKTWNKLGRRVRPGERGIIILAPITIQKSTHEPEKNGESNEVPKTDERMITFFKPVHVYDETQTEGAELPDIIKAQGDASLILPALREAVRRSGVILDYDASIPGSPGATGISCGGRIILRNDLEPADEFRALTHEYAHELQHWNGNKEETVVEETEADAAAFVVCRHFGIHCDTRDYLMLHHSDPSILLERLETIRQTAAHIIGMTEKASPGKMEPPQKREENALT